MVFAGCRQEEVKQQEESNKMKSGMAMNPERSRTLHNFSLPCWGSRRHLRCVKDNGDSGSHINSSGGGGDNFPALDRRSPASSSKSPYHHHHNESTAARFSRKPPLGPEWKRKRSFFDSSKRSRDQNLPSENGRKYSLNSSPPEDNNGIEAMRKKLVLDLQTEMNRMKFAVLNTGNSKKEMEIKPPATVPLTQKTDSAPLTLKTDSAMEEARPWNLRKRRAVCKESNGNHNGGGGCKELRIDERKPNSMTPTSTKSPVQRWSDGEEKRPRPKFSVGLSKHEIEEDFVAIMGTRPPKRPKKRLRGVQKQVDAVFPGLWLTEITADMYKVNENPEVKKR